MGAAELVHEVGDHAVEVKTVVVTVVGKVDEVVYKSKHLINITVKFKLHQKCNCVLHQHLHTVTGILSAYSSTSKEPIVVLIVANLDILKENTKTIDWYFKVNQFRSLLQKFHANGELHGSCTF